MTCNTLFFPEVFSLNDKIKEETIITPLAKVTVIKNFYKNPRKVLKEVKKLPAVKVTGNYSYKNGDLYLDLRKSYVPSMPGTELPYPSQLLEYLPNILGVNKNRLMISENLLVNCFKKLKNKFSEEKSYYGAHVDDNYFNLAQVAIVVFLNIKYSDGEGLNFYHQINRTIDNNTPFTDNKETELLYFIQAEPNMAVLFDSFYPHGQAIGGEQFFNDTRYTQVIFVGIK